MYFIRAIALKQPIQFQNLNHAAYSDQFTIIVMDEMNYIEKNKND